MKRVLLFLFLLLALGWASNAQAQCSANFGANQVCGSSNGGLPGPINTSTFSRTKLTGNVSYYVNGNSGGTATCGPAGVSTCVAGNDGNNCLTPATACLTLQHAFTVVVGTVDFAGLYTGTIYLAHNTGTSNYSLSCTLGPWIGSSVVFIRGDSTDAPGALTVITDPALGSGLAMKNLCTLDYKYVSFADNATNNGVAHITVGGAGNSGHLDLGNVSLGSMTIGTMVSAGYGQGTITATGPITIAGGAPAAIEMSNAGTIDLGSQAVTLANATVTITIAAPGLITWTAHGLTAGSPVGFTTSSALPTGLAVGTVYYVTNDASLTTNTFHVSDTSAHALAGTNTVTTTGSQSGTQTGTPGFPVAFAYMLNGGTLGTNGSNFSGSATGVKCLITGSLELAGFDPNVVFPGSSNCTANNLVQSVNVTSGTLAAGANAFLLTATQPASPVGLQNAVAWTVTGAGSASQNNNAMFVQYLAGYTGSSNSAGLNIANGNAGTGGALSSSGGATGNFGGSYVASGTTTGYNFGVQGRGNGGNVNFGIDGLSVVAKNSATNIGVMGMGINTGSSPVYVGGWFSNGQTAVPTTSAALIADNVATGVPIALWQANGATVASVNATGGLTATLTNASANEIVCYATSTGLMSYENSVAGCVPSDPALKIAGPALNPADALVKVAALVPGSGQFKPETGLSQDQQVWLYADQVCAMDKRLCVKDASGALNYDKVGALAYAFAAIKELKSDNDNLRACQNSWKCRLFGALP